MMHYIHCHQAIDLRKGGTVGYCSSLLDGMHKLGSFQSQLGLRHAFLFPDISQEANLPPVAIEQLKYYQQFSSAYSEDVHKKNGDRSHWFHSVIPLSEAKKINLKKITSVHIHGAYNFLPVYNFLRLCGIENDVVKILTTHNPWKPEEEDIFHFNKNKSPEQRRIDLPKEEAYRHYLQLRDDFAFRMADALFFPSKHSMEGYYSNWPEFANLTKNKPIYFSLTGTEKKEVTVPRTYMRKLYNIPEDARVFLYLGRFIPMRGFDLYVEAAKKILAKHPNAYFLAVGEKREPCVEHPRWIQIEYTDTPGNFLSMADACVMANRGSYFDLAMIETLAEGTFLIAAKVGGYRYLEHKTKGVLFFTPEKASELFDACDKFYSMEAQDLVLGRKENIALYEKEMTPEKFAQGYFDTIDDIYTDFNRASTIKKVNPLWHCAYPLEKIEILPVTSSLIKKTKIEPIESKPLQTMPKKASKSIKLLINEGVILYRQGLYQPAANAFYDLLKKDPNMPNIRRRLAEVLYASGQRREAIVQLKIARAILSKNKELRRRLLKMQLGPLALGIKSKVFM
jgi:glycosyltransferase involved in cell wall biosynthesis